MKHLLLTVVLGLSLSVVGCSKKSKSAAKKKTTTETTETTDTTRRSRPTLSRKARGLRRAKVLQKRLGLSDEQTTKLETVFSEGNPREHRAKMKEVLTDEQWKKMSAVRRNSLGRRFGLSPERRAKFMKSAFGLTDDQETKLVGILQNMKGKERATAIKNMMTPAQRERWNKVRKKRGVHRPQPGGGFGPGHRIVRPKDKTK